MPSLFYREHFQPYPVTLLLLEHFSLLMDEQSKLPEEEQATFEVVATQALNGAKVMDHEPEQEDLLYLYERVQSLMQENNNSANVEPGSGGKKHFGSNYMNWLEELDSEKLCLFSANYDYKRALQLYSEVDRNAVIDIAKLRAEGDWQGKLAAFEACLFGFGGGYGESSTKVIDMKKDPKGAEAAIRSMGF